MDFYPLMACLLVVIGLGIIASEIFIPSAGMLSILALGCFCGSVFCAWRAWYEPGHFTTFWVYLTCMVIGIPAFIGTGLWLLPKTALGNRLLAAPQNLESLTPFQEEEKHLTGLINECGLTTTLFSPGGMVQIGGDRFHAESEGLMIDPQTEVIVVGTKGNRLLVRPVTLNHTAAGDQDHAEEESVEGQAATADTPFLEIDIGTATADTATADTATADTLPATESEDSHQAEVSSAGSTPGNTDADSANAPIDFDIPDTT